MNARILIGCGLTLLLASACSSDDAPSVAKGGDASCKGLPDATSLKKLLREAADSTPAGGLMNGELEWAAVVNRAGAVCTIVASTDTASEPWPGSRTIALAKAYTANAFSTDTLAMSTARLYTLSLPGHSLYGAGAGNPFNPLCYGGHGNDDADDVAIGKVCGGTIAFGGGLPLYQGGSIIGGLGVSGDTPCADHEIAKRIRGRAGLIPAKGNFADDVTYAVQDPPSLFVHPLCPNTWRNGQKIGEEAGSGPIAAPDTMKLPRRDTVRP